VPLTPRTQVAFRTLKLVPFFNPQLPFQSLTRANSIGHW
jgi:hypothetical protein